MARRIDDIASQMRMRFPDQALRIYSEGIWWNFGGARPPAEAFDHADGMIMNVNALIDVYLPDGSESAPMFSAIPPKALPGNRVTRAEPDRIGPVRPKPERMK